MSSPIKRILVVRLSSMGDLVLSTAALEAYGGEISLDWLVAEEFRTLLQGHPRLNQVFGFDRKSGLASWLFLARSLWESSYDEVLDLHASLRTRLMRAAFLYFDVTSGRKTPWRRVKKERSRLLAYFLFKRRLPRGFRPRHWISKFVRAASGLTPAPGLLHQQPRPNCSYLLERGKSGEPREFLELLNVAGPQGYFCVMPSSNWKGKNWPVEKYAELLRSSAATPVILGMPGDAPSVQLVELLSGAGISHFSGIGKWNLRDLAFILKHSRGLISGDTGLVHLAQALGVKVVSIFGPTTPEMGFGPWTEGATAVGADLWCRPCSKDGRGCFRFTDKYSCLNQVSVDQVTRVSRVILGRDESGGV